MRSADVPDLDEAFERLVRAFERFRQEVSELTRRHLDRSFFRAFEKVAVKPARLEAPCTLSRALGVDNRRRVPSPPPEALRASLRGRNRVCASSGRNRTSA